MNKLNWFEKWRIKFLKYQKYSSEWWNLWFKMSAPLKQKEFWKDLNKLKKKYYPMNIGLK